MKTSIVGYPRVGKDRELKYAIEKYWKGVLSKRDLYNVASNIKSEQWKIQKAKGINYIPSNTFSYYDSMLDLAVMLNAVGRKYTELDLDSLDTYFVMGRGYQGEKGDVKALSMKKWFNTNYHYMVPELDDTMKIRFNGTKLFTEYEEAKKIGINTRPVTIGIFTFMKLAITTGKKSKNEFIGDIVSAFCELLDKCNERGIEWIQIDEPILVTDLSKKDIDLFIKIYSKVLEHKKNVKVLLQTYFGDVRDCYKEIIDLKFDGLGLDFLEGKENLALVKKYGFPENKVLFAGLVNGKNIWKSNYSNKIPAINSINRLVKNVVLSSSCSLLHVPYTIKNETDLPEDICKYFSFAEEKITELVEIGKLVESPNYLEEKIYIANQEIVNCPKSMSDDKVKGKVAKLADRDFIRKGRRIDRQKLQKETLNIPLLPTTTIGSFPQTVEVKRNRRMLKNSEISNEEYESRIFQLISDCIKLQEDIGLDVLVHGEYERNDMVEFFGENLDGFVFSKKGWVQSYGTRCVKPPIIFGDIKRTKPITVMYSKYAQSLSNKCVKGMLTGPVTILNWSFPREDVSLSYMTYEIALAIREEVLDLERAGIKIIQIDEAALREKLPLRKEEWHSKYLDWAIKAFRLCQSGVNETTQIHTHMCYSEFEDIIKEIDEMDADVITFEASRSKLTILDSINNCGFETEVGPGVYDIHSPRIPSVDELTSVIYKMLKKVSKENLWINPDCGLKTRGIAETVVSLNNMVKATNNIRNMID